MELLPKVQVDLVMEFYSEVTTPDTWRSKFSAPELQFQTQAAVPGTTEKLTATPTDCPEPLAKLVLLVN